MKQSGRNNDVNNHPAIVLRANSISKRYPRGQGWVDALKQISLTLSVGEVFSLLGPNGAGKTTTVKILAGLIEPDTGVVERPSEADVVWVGAVLEGNRNLYWRLTALENLIYFGTLRGLTSKDAVERGGLLLDRIGMAEKASQTVGTLSRGQQQRVALAAALVHDPPVLFLDEPTLGVDIEAQRVIGSLIVDLKNAGKAILLTTHNLEFAEGVSDRVAIILSGTIAVDGDTRNILNDHPRTSYRIELMEPIPSDSNRLNLIQQYEAVVEGAVIQVIGRDTLWEVLRILDPLPLEKVERESLSLSGLFWRTLEKAKEGKRDDL